MRALLILLLLTGPAFAQGESPLADLTPEQRRAFCLRVGEAALRCGTADVPALAACLLRTLPVQDSLRAGRIVAAARGNPSSLIAECGITR
jgi:hypothetical protein